MANANARINIDINTSEAAAGLRQLQSQITAFNSTLTKSSAVQATAMRNSSQNLLELVNASRFFTAETVKMQTAASSLDKTLSKGQVTLGQFFGARFRKDSLAAAQVMSLANTRAQALQTQFVATGAAANGMRDAIAIRPLQAFNDAAVVSAQKLAIHRAMLQQATTQMINFGKNTQWAGRQLMVGFTVPLTIFGGIAGKTFRDLEREAVNFRKVYGDAFTPPEEMEQNLAAVQELAKEYTKYGIAVKDTIGLAAQAAAAGAQNKDLLDATAQATRLSTLGQMEQNEALETTISLQNAFKLSGDDLAKSINFLNMVENQTVVTLQDLSAAIPRVAPVIKGLGGDVEDLAAFMAALQEGGVTAEQGANALKSGLASLINPTDRAKEKLDSLGISLDSIIQMNRGDLMGTVQDFATALDTLDEFTRQQALEEVFGKFQYARLGALFANINKDGTQAARVLEMTGMSAAEMAASAEKELSAIEEAVGTKFTAAMERLQLAIAPIGEMFTKMAIPIINFFGSIIEKFNELPDFAKNFLGLSTVIVGIVIPAGTMFLGLLMNLIGTLVKFGSLVGIAFKGFTSGGIKGAFDAVSQAIGYMSLAEMDAVNSAQQLAISAEAVNQAFLEQVVAGEGAQSAIMELAYAYEILTNQMMEAAVANELAFGVGAGAIGAAGARGPRVRRNRGGTIPGSGNTDKVAAMLTPGEFVVNKQATQDNLPLLRQINEGGKVPGFMAGTIGAAIQAAGAIARARPLTTSIGRSLVSMPTAGTQAGMVYSGRMHNAHMTSRRQVVLPSPFRPDSLEANNWLMNKIPGNSKKARVARELARRGLTGGALSNDSIGLPWEINDAARTGSTRLMTIAQAADMLEMRGAVKITSNTAMSKAGFPIGANEELGKSWAAELRRIARTRGNSQITDDILSEARNNVLGSKLADVRAATSFDYAGIIQSRELQRILGIDSLEDVQRVNSILASKGFSGVRVLESTRPGGTKRIEVIDSQGNTLVEMLSGQDKLKTETGRSLIRLNKGNIVPGTGNKDTVPAMLTPGEFVVNKKATQQNMALLKAINEGKIRGYAAGDVVGDKRNGFYAEGTNGMKSGPFPTRRMAKKEARQIVKTLGISRPGGMSMRGMGMGMGMGMAGGAMMMTAGMMPNQGLSTAMSAGGTALSMASILPMIGVGGPLTLAIAGIAAAAVGAGVAIKAWRESVDSAARSAAEFGANLGGTANALNTIATITGQQTPLQRRRQVELGLTNADIENIMSTEMSAMLSSEKGQALIEELDAVTSAERFQKLADYLKNAIATGLMDKQMATSFAKAVSFELNDSLLSSKVVKTISGQGTGSMAMMGLAEERTAAADSLFRKLEDEYAIAAENMQAGYTQSIRISGDTPSQVIGLAIQGLQDYANVQALAQEELANGTITFKEFAKINEQVIDQQNKFRIALESSIKFAADPGAVMQGTIDQLVSAGIATEEQIKSLEDAAKVRATSDFSTAEAIEAQEGLKSLGIAALATGTDIVSVNSALRDLASVVTGGTNAMKVAFDAVGTLEGAIAEVSIMELIGGQAPGREAATREQLRGFIKGGGDTAGLQSMLATMTPQEAANTMGVLGGLGDVSTQNKFISDFQNLTSTVGTEFARQITMSEDYIGQLKKGQTTLIDTVDEAATVFGEKTQEMFEYADKSGIKIEDLVKKAKDLQSLPEEAIFKLGIDITDPKDLERFGPIADDINANWPVLSKLPEEINLNAFVNANINENGQLAPSEDLANAVIKVRKAMADLDSVKPNIVKNAAVNIMVSEGMSMTDAKTAFDNIISGMEDFNNFEVEDKFFVIQAAVDLYDAIKALEALQQVNSGDLDGGIRALRIAQEQNVQRAQGRLTGAEQAGRINIAGGRRGAGGGGGGGTPEKTLFQELKEQAQASQKMFAGISELGDQRGFKKFISGPFAPEFLEYLRSQGEKGLKIIKGGLDKVKKAYSNFIADRSAQMAAEAAIAPRLRQQEMDFMQKEVDMRRQLASQGRSQEEIDFIVENTMEKQKQIATNKQLIKETDKTTEAGKKRIKNLREHNQALRLDIQDVKKNASAYIELQKALEFAGMSMRELDMLIYQNSQTIKDLERRIEEFNKGGLIDLQDQLGAQEKIIEGINRTVELRQRDADAISRTIDLKQREIEPLEKAIQAYEKQIDQIEDYYDIQLQALDDVANAEERLNDIREGRLDVASALSRGDVAGAARAAVEMRRRFAEQQQDATRQALEKRRQEEVDAIQANIKQTQEQRVKIEEEIEQLQLQQRDIQDEIYNLQQSMIPVQDEIYRLNVAITNEADRLDDKYRDAAAEVANLKNELAEARDRAIELAAARANAGAGGDVSGAAPTSAQPAGPTIEELANKVVSGTATQAETDAWFDQLMANINAPYAMGGKVRKYAMGGMVNYKGSREPAPGFMMGGKIKKMAFGSFVPGRGMTDKVPAMLTPGEFVVRKPVAEKLGPMLQSLNSQVFPGMGVPQQRSMSVSAPQFDTMKRISSDNVRFGVPQSINSFTYPTTNMNITQSNTDMSPTNYNVGPTNVQYTYNLNISTETDASPDDIANTVMYRIKRFEDRRIKGTEIG